MKTDEEINEKILIHIYDNLPYDRSSNYSYYRVPCDFCEQKHGQADTCDLKVNKVSGNNFEGAKQIKLKDVLEGKRHKRQIIFGVIFKPNTGF